MKEIKKEKRNIRNTVLVQCKRLDLETFVDSAIHLISKEKAFSVASTVFVYKPFGHEIPFIEELVKRFPQKEYYYPIMNDRKMHFEYAKPDVIFVPAITVDKSGNRLGRGWGCYDRFLSGQSDALTICVVPECAVVDNLPTEPHDIAVNKIIVCKQSS